MHGNVLFSEWAWQSIRIAIIIGIIPLAVIVTASKFLTIGPGNEMLHDDDQQSMLHYHVKVSWSLCYVVCVLGDWVVGCPTGYQELHVVQVYSNRWVDIVMAMFKYSLEQPLQDIDHTHRSYKQLYKDWQKNWIALAE